MNSLILISPSLVRGFQPILSGKFKTGGRNLSLVVMYARRDRVCLEPRY